MEKPVDAAFSTCQKVATKCNVSVSTVDRVAAMLGFECFAEFRDLFRQSLRTCAASKAGAEPAAAHTDKTT